MSSQAPCTRRNKPGRKTTASPEWTCPECNKSITRITDAKRHLYSHLPPKHFCPLVGCKRNTQAFTQRSHLKTHLNSVHYKSKTYVCAQCPKSYFDPASLHRHRKVAHGPAKQEKQAQNNTIDLTLPSVVDASAYTPVAGPSSQQYVKTEETDPVFLQSFSPVAGPSGLHPAPEFVLKPEDVDNILSGAFHCGTYGDYQETQFLPLPAPECSEADLFAGMEMEKWMFSPEYMYLTSSYNALGFVAQPQPYLQSLPFPYAQQAAPIPAPTPIPVPYTQSGYGTIDPNSLMLPQPPFYTHEQQAALAAVVSAGAVPYLPSRETTSSPFGNESVSGGEFGLRLSPEDMLSMQQYYSYGDYVCWQ